MKKPTKANWKEKLRFWVPTVLGILAVLLCAHLYSLGLLDQNLGSPVPTQNAPLKDGELRVHFLDTDQSECIVIQYRGNTILMDTANQGYGSLIAGYLWSNYIYDIDLLILTHPHSDHIGSASAILEKFPVQEVLLPNIPAKYLTGLPFYDNFLTAAKEKECMITYAQPGTSFILDDKVTLSVLGPLHDYGENLNNCSLVTKLTFGDYSFLFTGDMEIPSETDLLDAGVDVSATVLKIGHHGSHTSSSPAFLSAVSPRYAVIQCGRNNDYGHPHQDTREALLERDIQVLRTDLDGDIVFTTDGASLIFTTQYGLE